MTTPESQAGELPIEATDHTAVSDPAIICRDVH